MKKSERYWYLTSRSPVGSKASMQSQDSILLFRPKESKKFPDNLAKKKSENSATSSSVLPLRCYFLLRYISCLAAHFHFLSSVNDCFDVRKMETENAISVSTELLHVSLRYHFHEFELSFCLWPSDFRLVLR